LTAVVTPQNVFSAITAEVAGAVDVPADIDKPHRSLAFDLGAVHVP